MFDKTKFLSIEDDATNPEAAWAEPNWMSQERAPLNMTEFAPATFDGEKGTYSDPQCSTCPWVSLDDDHLERIHSAWLAMSPQGREECARYYSEACAASMQAQFEAESESFWMRQGRHH